LLYNRGTVPRKAGRESVNTKAQDSLTLKQQDKQRERLRWLLILRLGGAVVAVDAYYLVIRWVHLNPDRSRDESPWTAETAEPFLRTLVGCLAETIAFHGGVILACAIVLNILDWVRTWKRSSTKAKISGIRQEFRYTLIPLTIFYSSLTKLFLLFLLSIWRPTPPEIRPSAHSWNGTLYDNVFVSRALEILDEDKLDREWVARNVLGGMAAGFGLRVVLDCHPIFTTVIILVGWILKTAVARVVSGWVGGDEKMGEAWLAYSIP